MRWHTYNRLVQKFDGYEDTVESLLEIEGKKHLDDALAGGKGAVLWVTHFCFSNLFTKMAKKRWPPSC